MRTIQASEAFETGPFALRRLPRLQALSDSLCQRRLIEGFGQQRQSGAGDDQLHACHARHRLIRHDQIHFPARLQNPNASQPNAASRTSWPRSSSLEAVLASTSGSSSTTSTERRVASRSASYATGAL